MTAIRELEFAVKELGLRGLNLQCFENKLRINDAKMYPLYAKCIELDIPVNIHCSINFSTVDVDGLRPAAISRRRDDAFSRAAGSAPRRPAGRGCHELIGGRLAPRQCLHRAGRGAAEISGRRHSGYEPLLQYGNCVLQDRIIFGTSYPMMPVERSMDEIEALPLKDGVKRKWMHDNAARFLGLEAPTQRQKEDPHEENMSSRLCALSLAAAGWPVLGAGASRRSRRRSWSTTPAATCRTPCARRSTTSSRSATASRSSPPARSTSASCAPWSRAGNIEWTVTEIGGQDAHPRRAVGPARAARPQDHRPVATIRSTCRTASTSSRKACIRR